MIVNLACFLKLCPRIWKSLPHYSPTPFLCMFILRFKLYSVFPRHCNLSQRQHSIIQVSQPPLQITLCLIIKVFLLKELWKTEQVWSCLQYRLIDLMKHSWLPPIMSPKLLFLLNAKIWGSSKTSFNFGLICKIRQF